MKVVVLKQILFVSPKLFLEIDAMLPLWLVIEVCALGTVVQYCLGRCVCVTVPYYAYPGAFCRDMSGDRKLVLLKLHGGIDMIWSVFCCGNADCISECPKVLLVWIFAAQNGLGVGFYQILHSGLVSTGL